MISRNIKVTILSALCISAPVSAQFLDPQILRHAADCASTGNCGLNNMEMNNVEMYQNDSNAEPAYDYRKADLARAQQQKAEQEAYVQSRERERKAKNSAGQTQKIPTAVTHKKVVLTEKKEKFERKPMPAPAVNLK